MIRVIAEIGTANHDIDYALECVKQAAGTGIWAIKSQLLNADTLVAKDAPRYDRLKGPANQYEQFKDAPPYEDWEPVFVDARARGVEMFASCWDEAAVEFCESMDVGWYKVGSADITNYRLLATIAETGKQVFFSVGAAALDEVDSAREILGINAIPMACTLSYPCEPQDARLERIGWLDHCWFDHCLKFVPFVGYSDHTRELDTGALAVAAGATYLEKHFTATPGSGGDHDFALDKDFMAVYVWNAERASRMTHSEQPIEAVLESELAGRERARRSLHAVKSISAGDSLIVGGNCLFLRPYVYPNQTRMPIGAEEWTQDHMGEAVRDYQAGEQI